MTTLNSIIPTRMTVSALITAAACLLTACDSPENESNSSTPDSKPELTTEHQSKAENETDDNRHQSTPTASKHASERKPDDPKPESKPPENLTYKTVEWTDLIPKDDLDALLNPPSYISEIEEGSEEDQVSEQFEEAIAAANKTLPDDEAEKDRKYQQALISARIIPELDNQLVRIAGFLAPIEFDDNQTITQFFLVPYFGACIHVPPPPPNQMIFVNHPEGVQIETLYEPFWVSGILKTSIEENDMATSAYAIELHKFEPYLE